MRRKIGFILLILGITTGLYFGYLSYNAQRISEETISVFEENFEELKAKAEEPEKEKEPVNPLESVLINGRLPLDEVIGIIEIPSLGVKAPLVEGEEERLLKYAVGRIEKSSLPGEDGNFVVGGHRNYVNSRYFKYLYKLVEGDLIHVKTFRGNYTYRVSKTTTVAPNEVWVMDKTETPTATLITCTTDSKRRTIVFADLIKKEQN